MSLTCVAGQNTQQWSAFHQRKSSCKIWIIAFPTTVMSVKLHSISPPPQFNYSSVCHIFVIALEPHWNFGENFAFYLSNSLREYLFCLHHTVTLTQSFRTCEESCNGAKGLFTHATCSKWAGARVNWYEARVQMEFLPWSLLSRHMIQLQLGVNVSTRLSLLEDSIVYSVFR